MTFTELGDSKHPVIMLIQGYKEAGIDKTEQIKSLMEQYRVVISDAKNREESSRTAARSIYHYIETQCEGKLYALCGFHDSWEITHELMENYNVDSCKVIVENNTSEPGKIIAKLMT